MAKKTAKKTTKSSAKPARKAPAKTAKTAKATKKTTKARAAAGKPSTKAPKATTKSAGKSAKKPTRVAAKVQMSALAPTQRQIRPIAPPQPGIPTNEKPKRNQAGLGKRDLEHYRQLLLAKRAELVGDMSQMEREALRSASGSNLSNLPVHMADMGTDNYEQEFTLGLVEKDRQLLREINNALAKIQDGTYGICEGTGKPISKARLEAQPWARHSIEYAREMEKGRMR